MNKRHLRRTPLAIPGKLWYTKDVKLKRIEIRGFKSIARKISLPVADGVTCIAGPNGCGKSNIIDAVRWALGEQSNRSLRAGSMSEVIFSGTQDAPPGSMAEVVMEFVRDGGYFPKTLEGFDEVSISRRLYRTGESIYSLNGVRCRLKDITDLFLDTGLNRHGYAIVEQGKVKDIIQSKPEDIRYLIEEAAEVGRFRFKRADAIKRLEATAANLERVRDLLTEVSRQRDELKSQANKARRYQSLRSEINSLTKMLWAYEILKITGKKEKLDEVLQEVQQQEESFRKQHEEYTRAMAGFEARLSAVRGNMDKIRRAMEETRSYELLAEGEIEANTNRARDISSTIEMLESRIGQMTRETAELHERGEQERSHLERLSQDIAQIEEELNSRNLHLESMEQEFGAYERDYSQKRAQLFDAIGHSRATQQRISSMETRRHEAETNARKRRADLSELGVQRASLESRYGEIEEEYDRVKSRAGSLGEKSKTLGDQMRELQSRIEATTHTLAGLEKSHAQLLAKISMLERIILAGAMPPPGDLPTNNGTRRVADALKAKSGFEETVGLSLGKSLDYLIVQDYEDILKLGRIEDGGPGYIPLRPHLNGRQTETGPQGEGVVARLKDLVEAKEGYEDVVHALSGDMWVVEDIHCALSFWKQGMRSCTFVTRDGVIIEPSGVVRTTAEMAKYAEGLKAKAEREELSLQEIALDREIASTKELLAQLRQEMQRIREDREQAESEERSLREQASSLSEKKNVASRELERISEREQSYRRDIEMWESMSEKVESDLADIQRQKQELDQQIESMQDEVKSLDEKRVAARQRLQSARESISAHTQRAGELKVTAAAARQRLQGIEEQLEGISRQISRDAGKKEELVKTLASVQDDLEKSRVRLQELQVKVQNHREALEAATPEHEKLLDAMASLTRNRDECRETLTSLEKKHNEILLKIKEQEIALTMSNERFASRFSGEDLPAVAEDFSPDDARQKIESLEGRIEKMGQINFASLDAFENVQARWDDLHRQYEDIVQASARLKEVIANIEKQSVKAFTETFEQVRHHFQELFAAMFGGGKADLVLLDGNSPDSGVEILACPPFKRLKSMSLLSEGEKTLCALSFIFALFKVRPSPFCILDEVDAPLDDANVVRFNRLIRTFAGDSQFIIVTHNRHTMEMSDILYGVTFDEPGISKVVSMSLQEA